MNQKKKKFETVGKVKSSTEVKKTGVPVLNDFFTRDLDNFGLLSERGYAEIESPVTYEEYKQKGNCWLSIRLKDNYAAANFRKLLKRHGKK